MYIPQSKYQSNLEKGEKISTLAVNVLTLSGFFSLFFGTLITYGYLDNIQQTAIFPDILTSPSSLLVLIAVFIMFAVTILGSMVIPYFVVKFINNKKIPLLARLNPFSNAYLYSHYDNLVTLSIIGFIILIFPIFDISSNKQITHGVVLISSIGLYCYKKSRLKKERIKYKETFWTKIFSLNTVKVIFNLIIILVSIVVFFCFSNNFVNMYFWSVLGYLCINTCWCIFLDNHENNFSDKVNSFFLISLLPLFFLISTLSFSLISIHVVDNVYSNNKAFAILFFMIFLWLIIYAVNARIAFTVVNQKRDIGMLYLIIPSILLFLMIYFLCLFDRNNQLSRLILKPLHFIEYPSNANWYTIDTRFFAPNNLNNQEIERHSKDLLAYFYSKQFETQCKYISDEKTKKQCEQSESEFQTQQKYNRFYGYVAWNLGDMKVFCPHGYEQARLDAQAGKKSNPIQCLALKSEYIIPYY